MLAKKSISRIFSVLFVIVFILAASPLQAVRAGAVLYAKPTASGTGDCLSWANACTLQTALTGALSGDEIWAAAGTYKPTTGTDRTATFQLKSGVALYGGFSGTENARSQRNPALNVTILSGEIGAAGNSDNSYHVVTGATGATLDGFTITAGNANGASDLFGGGMVSIGSSPALTNVTFSGNSATYGGGMANISGSPTLTNVTFSGNTASVFGGGMYNYDSATLTNVTFSGNSATYGGGMANGSGSPTLTNVTFSGNSASSSGGGMFNSSSSPAQVRNTIFWGNTALSGAQIDTLSSYPVPVLSYSVVQGGYAGGTNILTDDPKLGTVGDYGGFTQTIPLLAGSSAIDAGDNATCAATDQRGYVRPVDGDGNGSVICDIGAYEAGSVPPPPPPPPVYVYLPLVQKSGPQITPTPTVTPGTVTPTSTPTTTPTRAPTTPPPPGPMDGIYKFSSALPAMDLNASLFRVSGNTITRLLVYTSISGCNFVYELPIPIIGGSFSYYQTDFTFSGDFTSSTTATGNITIHCNPYYYSSGIWQASWWGSYP